jgi:Flp pilus assembly protein TadG
MPRTWQAGPQRFCRRALRALSRDRRAVIAMWIALIMLPLAGLVGLGIDYGFAIRAQAQLNSAADAAAIAATDTASNAVVNAQTNFIAAGQAAGAQLFNAMAVNLTNVQVSPVSVVVTQVTPNSATFSTVVTYTATYKTWFGRIFGVMNFPISGTSNAQAALDAYQDYHILMDVSSSMGIAATPAGMAALGPLTLAASNAAANSSSTLNGKTTFMNGAATANCAFACHWDNNNPGLNDFYEIARKNNIQLRIDLEKTAVNQVITAMNANETLVNQYRVAIYGFNSAFSVVYKLSSDLIDGATAAAGMSIPVVPGEQNVTDTNFGNAMTSIAQYIPTPGNGSTASNPAQFLFIVTDGIDDYWSSSCNNPAGRCQNPMSASNCTALKNLGVTILVLYVQYVPLDTSYGGVDYSNGWYKTYIQQYVDPGGTITPNNQVYTSLQACATTPNLFFYASDSTQIGTQMTAMLKAAQTSGVHFTQ